MPPSCVRSFLRQLQKHKRTGLQDGATRLQQIWNSANDFTYPKSKIICSKVAKPSVQKTKGARVKQKMNKLLAFYLSQKSIKAVINRATSLRISKTVQRSSFGRLLDVEAYLHSGELHTVNSLDLWAFSYPGEISPLAFVLHHPLFPS